MEKKHLVNGGILIVALMAANFFNFLFNALLGRWLSFENFGLITLVVTFYYVSGIVTNALAASINFSTSKLLGADEKEKASSFFQRILHKSVLISIVLAGVWILSTPILMSFFQVSSPWPFLAFAPIIVFSTYQYDITGYFQGKLQFAKVGLILVIEPVAKLIAGVFITLLGFGAIAYFSLPLSLVIGAGTSLAILYHEGGHRKIKIPTIAFPTHFFTNSLTVSIGSTIFFSIDLILVRHFFSPTLTGQYALISLIGKMMFFFSTVFNAFTLPSVARTNDKRKLNQLFLSLVGITTVLTFTGWILIGLFGHVIVPILFGKKVLEILYLLPLYTFGIALYSISSVVVSFHLSRQHYLFSYYPILAGLFFSLLTIFRHSNLYDITSNITLTCFLLLFCLTFLHLKFQFKEYKNGT